MANSNTTPTYPLHIADISVDFSKSGNIKLKNVHSAEARIGNSEGPIENRVGKTTLSQTFVPPMRLSLQDSFHLRLLYKRGFASNFRNKTDSDDVHFDVEHIFHTYRELGGPYRREYHTSRGKIDIVLRLSGNPSTDGKPDPAPTTGNSSTDETTGLVPTTDDVFRICPRVRILVTGKTGVGKSSLIEHAFGVEKDLVSNLERGKANIDTEFISPQNNRFVLHDSNGFEPGEQDNVKIVREFIECRRNMPDLGEQLHAIWLCIQTPSTGGRLLETGTEDFLKLKCGGQLGNVPVIVVFTQYDKLVDQVDYELGPSLHGLSDNAMKELIGGRADTKLQESATDS